MKKSKFPRKPLTHFLCLVSAGDSHLTNALCDVQNAVVEQFRLPPEIRVNVKDDLHVTLMVLSLQSDEEEKYVLQVVEQSKELGPANGISTNFNGLGRFGGQVLWARPDFPKREEYLKMLEWRNHIHRSLIEFSCDNRPWSPHATIMKTSKLRRNYRDILITDEMAQFASDIFRKNEAFPAQAIHTVTLMSCMKDGEGRYIRRGTVSFQEAAVD